jgi:nicotinate phosphoribosyltransferase
MDELVATLTLATGCRAEIPPAQPVWSPAQQFPHCRISYSETSVIIDLARRAHDHNWELDPITRSLLDTDFYKLLMLQFIWKHFPHVHATFTLINRTASVRLAEVISVEQLRTHLEATRKLRFTRSELIWLAGNTFYGRRGIFDPAFLDWLAHGFRLSDYELSVRDGQFALQFEGPWCQTTMWELYALSQIAELRTRASLKRLGELELDILYARAKTRLWEKMARLRGVPGLSVSDFGTRRRHSFLWHEYVVSAMRDTLGEGFTGTSNAFLAYKHDLEAIGTNGHELPMAMAALANSADKLRSAQYRLLELWQQSYQGELLILLPDTFGTTQFLCNAPAWVANWTGLRMDSKNAYTAGDEYIAWLERQGRDPRQKRLIASDALDVEQILGLHAYFAGTILNGAAHEDFRSAADFLDRNRWLPQRRIRFSAGWGTLLTNDFRNCNPQCDDSFNPLSVVCKLSEVEGRAAVKLSDNPSKALGNPQEVERYRRVFGMVGMADVPVFI